MDSNRDFTPMVEQLGSRETLIAAWRALHGAGKDALPAIRTGLSSPNWRVRQWCATLIDTNWDEPSLRRLLLALYDPKLKVRKAAAHSLGCDRCKQGENPIDVLPYLEERLREDKSIKVRRTCAWTLAAQQPNRRIARVLRRALRDETDSKLRIAAQWGVKRYEDSLVKTESSIPQ